METLVTFLLGLTFLCIAALLKVYQPQTKQDTSPYLYVYASKQDAEKWRLKAQSNKLSPSKIARTQSGWTFVVNGRHELNQVIRKKL